MSDYIIKCNSGKELEELVNYFGNENVCSKYYARDKDKQLSFEERFANGDNTLLYEEERPDCIQTLYKPLTKGLGNCIYMGAEVFLKHINSLTEVSKFAGMTTIVSHEKELSKIKNCNKKRAAKR